MNEQFISFLKFCCNVFAGLCDTIARVTLFLFSHSVNVQYITFTQCIRLTFASISDILLHHRITTEILYTFEHFIAHCQKISCLWPTLNILHYVPHVSLDLNTYTVKKYDNVVRVENRYCANIPFFSLLYPLGLCAPSICCEPKKK